MTQKHPRHIAFIPDGNRRKAVYNKIPIKDTYLIGAEKGLEVISWCREIGVRHWSAFGASHENILKRPLEEVIAMFGGALKLCRDLKKDKSITIHVFGDIAEISGIIPSKWKEEFLEFQQRGRPEGEFVVHIGVNYSAETDLLALTHTSRRKPEDVMPNRLNNLLLSGGVPDVELLIRTGGKQRLSGFLPYQLRYAELYFLPCLWAEFARNDFNHALKWFIKQDRNFGQ